MEYRCFGSRYTSGQSHLAPEQTRFGRGCNLVEEERYERTMVNETDQRTLAAINHRGADDLEPPSLPPTSEKPLESSCYRGGLAVCSR
jgi:hypothetical protein